jgi:delta24-sterol reductase
MKHLQSGLDFFHDLVEIYPVWMCPCKFFNKPSITPCRSEASSELYVDIGIYGLVHPRKRAEFEFIPYGQKMESFVLDHAG